jgi:hypothetical protein
MFNNVQGAPPQFLTLDGIEANDPPLVQDGVEE